MKVIMIAAGAAVLASALPFAAWAQEGKAATGVYANIGSADAHTRELDLGTLFGRLGYRFNPWIGIEGEIAGGLNSDRSTHGVSPIVVAPSIFGARISSQEAIYGVGFWPVAPNWDLIGRIGYGHTRAKITQSGEIFFLRRSVGEDSWNSGVGAQYHWAGRNGVRADYTRQEFDGRVLDHADVWSFAYSRRF
jgi:outer membrane immunogenic protein